MKNLRARDVMAPYPVLIEPHATLEEAARRMETANCGVLPVGTKSGLEGIITDRDIVIRALAKGREPSKEKVADHMTRQVWHCRDDDTLLRAVEIMRKHRVGRLVVKDEAGDVCGILSFGGVFRNEASPDEIATMIEHILTGSKAA